MQEIHYSKKNLSEEDFDFVKQSKSIKNNIIADKLNLLTTCVHDSFEESFILTLLAIICSLSFLWVLVSY